MRITQVSSGLIATQMLTSVAPFCAARLGDERRLEAEREAAAGERGGADHELAAGETLAVSKDHFFHGCLPHDRRVARSAARPPVGLPAA